MTNRTTVHVKTKDQCYQLMVTLEKLGYLWTGGRDCPTDKSIDIILYSELCISLDTNDLRIAYSPIDFYKENGLKIFMPSSNHKPNLNSRLIKCIEEVYKINQ